jgi:hypothetical protein
MPCGLCKSQLTRYSLVNAGRVGAEQPKRFYKFALVDPLDCPYVSFRYYYRTWEQLAYLGLFDEEGETSDLPGADGAASTRKDTRQSSELEDVFTSDSLSERGDHSALPEDHPLGGISVCNASCERSPRESPAQGGRESKLQTPPNFYRLSIPPSLKLAPPDYSSRPLPAIPQKHNPSSSLEYRPHPHYAIDEWVARTPSPVKSIRDGISTPPLTRRRGLSATSLMNVVASAWKRRGTPSSDSSGSRIVPAGRAVSR